MHHHVGVKIEHLLNIGLVQQVASGKAFYGGTELYHLVRMYRYQFSTVANRPQKALHEHRRIVEAIEARDAEMAELLMRRHISRARENIEQQAQQRSPQ